MNSQVLVDRELLQELADFCSDSRSYKEAMRVLNATPAPIPDAGEGVEVVGHQFQDRDGSWCIFTSERHYEMTKVDGSWPIRDLCRHSEALAGYAVRDARIAELEGKNARLTAGVDSDMADIDRMQLLYDAEFRKCRQLRAELAALNAKLDASKFCANVADDLRAELAAIKAQEPVAAQQRFRHPQKGTPDWSIWQPTPVNNGRAKWCIDGAGYEVEYQPLYAAPVAKQVVMPEPSFYWADSEEGSFGSPEEWAQDYYDYNGEKPESVLLSCAASLPDREYDSFEFDGSGNCISCRLVGEDSARLNAADHAEGGV